MAEELNQFQLSANEWEYLQQLLSHDEALATLLKFQKGAPGRKVIIQLSRAQAEQLRDYLTSRLAAVGFNDNYSPNEQGQMLEELIDRFYVS